jgi:hypothetical protein
MRYPKPETVNGRLALNSKLTQKVRLAALAAISRPSLRLLYRLLSDPKTPSRLLALASQKYTQEMVRKELRNRARTRT